jgi:hypothetical protein
MYAYDMIDRRHPISTYFYRILDIQSNKRVFATSSSRIIASMPRASSAMIVIIGRRDCVGGDQKRGTKRRPMSVVSV